MALAQLGPVCGSRRLRPRACQKVRRLFWRGGEGKVLLIGVWTSKEVRSWQVRLRCQSCQVSGSC